MHTMGNTISVKTRLPLTAWVLAGCVTLSSLLSTLIQAQQVDRMDAANLAPICQPDRSCDRAPIQASVIR